MNPNDRRAAWVRALAVDEVAMPPDLADRALAAAARAPREQPFVDAVLDQARRLVWWSGACATACAVVAVLVATHAPSEDLPSASSSSSSSSSSSMSTDDAAAIVGNSDANPLVSWWDAHLETSRSSWAGVLPETEQR